MDDYTFLMFSVVFNMQIQVYGNNLKTKIWILVALNFC